MLAVRGGGPGRPADPARRLPPRQANLSNHIAVADHYDKAGTLWCAEGRPGDVGWRDARTYLDN